MRECVCTGYNDDLALHSSEPLLRLSGERDHPDTTQPLNVKLTFSLKKATSTNSLVAYMYLNLFCMPFIPFYFSFIFPYIWIVLYIIIKMLKK